MRQVPASFSRQGLRLAPFAAAGCLPYVLLTIPPTAWSTSQLLLSAVLTGLVAAAGLLVPWMRMPGWTHVLPPLGYLVALAILRDAGAGADAGVGVLVLLPVFWVSMYGTRCALIAVLAGALAFFIAPVLLFGAPEYPASGIRTGILLTATAGMVGVSVQRLVGRIRAHARERDALLAHVSALAHTDALTTLPNRRSWDAELQRALARAQRSGEPLTVALLDLDHFKAFNDTHGHEDGDRLLAQRASAWRAQLRPDDVLSRRGGDEFAILLPATDANGARSVLNRLLGAAPGEPTCSIGHAQWDGTASATALLAAADAALYEAKRAGRSALVSAM